MDIESLKDAPFGDLLEIQGVDGADPYDTWGFLPAPLPDALELAHST